MEATRLRSYFSRMKRADKSYLFGLLECIEYNYTLECEIIGKTKDLLCEVFLFGHFSPVDSQTHAYNSLSEPTTNYLVSLVFLSSQRCSLNKH